MKRFGLVASMMLLAVTKLAAQVPAGGEFQVNTFTTLQQIFPAVAVERDGDFILVWSSLYQDGSNGPGVFAQRYDAAGAPRGGEFRVNTYTTGAQSGQDVDVDRAGNFVVVWSSDPEPGGVNSGIFGQRYDALGNAVGGEFHVNTFTPYTQARPRVAMAPAGSFVVVWGSVTQDGDNYGVFARRYDAAGNPVGGEFQVNTATTSIQIGQHVDMDAAGNFVVVWTGPGTHLDVFGQRFDAGGGRLGGEFRVNTYTTYSQGGYGAGPKVAVAADGAFVVVWENYAIGTQRINGQRYDRSGSPVGGEFVLNPNGAELEPYADIDADAQGNLVVAWSKNFPDVDISARRAAASGVLRGSEFRVNTYTTDRQRTSAVGCDDVGNFVVAWSSNRQDGSYYGVFAQRFGGLRPHALAVDPAGNRVLDPGETAVVQPSWRNINGASLTFGGALSSLSGPAGPVYAITDAAATYGTVANAATGTCPDCYGVQVSGARPATHWDASMIETITPDTLGQQKQWTLHVGASFTDVSPTSSFYPFIEALLHNGVTGGCGAGLYCPSSATAREQMAVFVLVTRERTGYVPPACGTPMFTDVPATSPFCRWIEELARRGVVSGCGSGTYCPGSPVSREQMAVFVLRTLDPGFTPPACGAPMFNDVPPTSPFCPWIEELTRRGVVSGCGPAAYCPADPVSREQMGVFLSATFGLTLYGP